MKFMQIVRYRVLQTILVLRGRNTVKLMQIVRYRVLKTILLLRMRDTVKLMQIVRYRVLETIFVLRGRNIVKVMQIVESPINYYCEIMFMNVDFHIFERGGGISRITLRKI